MELLQLLPESIYHSHNTYRLTDPLCLANYELLQKEEIMRQVVKMTHSEKVAMYMKSTRRELIEMLIESNRTITIIKEREGGECPKWDLCLKC